MLFCVHYLHLPGNPCKISIHSFIHSFIAPSISRAHIDPALQPEDSVVTSLDGHSPRSRGGSSLAGGDRQLHNEGVLGRDQEMSL